MTAFEVSVCASCGRAAFPPRLVCRHCGSLAWRAEPEPEGVLRYATLVRRKLAANQEAAPPRVGLVVTDRGLRVVVGVDEGAESGARVRLTERGGGVYAEPLAATDGRGGTEA